MTLTAAWWLYDKVDPKNPVSATVTGVAALHVAGLPYDHFIRASQTLRDINWWSDVADISRRQHQIMTKRGMHISASSARHFGVTSGTFVPGTARYTGHAGARILRGRGARIAAKLGARFVPGLGWGMLAYDIYTVGKMIAD